MSHAYHGEVAEGEKTVASNRKANREYAIEDRFEAGVALLGTEVKSIRAGHVSLAEAYARVVDGEAWLLGARIEPYTQGGQANHDPLRERKLLLSRRELDRIATRIEQRGYTLVPMRLYLKRGRVKIDLGLGKGRSTIDKRDVVAERDAKREIDRAIRSVERA